jgi:hypothetical protein
VRNVTAHCGCTACLQTDPERRRFADHLTAIPAANANCVQDDIEHAAITDMRAARRPSFRWLWHFDATQNQIHYLPNEDVNVTNPYFEQ